MEDRIGVAEAALILGTSQSWVRNLIRENTPDASPSPTY